MKLLIDMNLSPDWVETLFSKGWRAIHFEEVLAKAALVTVDENKARVRVLPLK